MPLSRRTKVLLVAAGVVLSVLTPVAIVVAEDILSGFVETSGEVHVKADNGPEVFWDKGYNISQGNAFTDNSFNLSTLNNGQVNFSASSGGSSLKVTQINGTFTNVTSADVSAADVTINPDDKQEVAIGGSMTELEFTNMTPDDGNTDFIYSATGSATLRITGLDANTQYGAVSVSTDEAIDVAETDGSGELTFTDLESNTDEAVELQELGELEIRNESEPHELVTDAEVEVKFYENEDDNPTIVNRTTSDGTVDLTGLPVDEQFVVTIRADGYRYRTIIIEDLAQQETAFVLNTSEDARRVTFTIDDDTGQFTGSDVEILIEHAINESLYASGGFSWLNAAGEQTGAIDSATFWMAHEERYRIKVRAEGDTRILGAFTPVVNETITLRPATPDINVTDEEGYAWNVTAPEDGSEVVFEFNDPDENTTDLRLRIYEQGNESNEIYDQTHAGPHGYLKVTQPLTGDQVNQTWTVDWNATRQGSTIGGERTAGRQVIDQIPQLDTVWQHAIAVLAVILTGALFSARNVETGAMTTAFVGGGFWMAGWLPTAAGGAITVAIFIVLAYKVSTRRLT